MFGIGAPELIVIFLIALFVLGPERLPGLARDVGRAMSDLRRASDQLTDEFLKADQARPTAIDTAAQAVTVDEPPLAAPQESTASEATPPETKT